MRRGFIIDPFYKGVCIKHHTSVPTLQISFAVCCKVHPEFLINIKRRKLLLNFMHACTSCSISTSRHQMNGAMCQ